MMRNGRGGKWNFSTRCKTRAAFVRAEDLAEARRVLAAAFGPVVLAAGSPAADSLAVAALAAAGLGAGHRAAGILVVAAGRADLVGPAGGMGAGGKCLFAPLNRFADSGTRFGPGC
jgi:hypothetical protein